MSISNQKARAITPRRIGRTLTSALALLAVQAAPLAANDMVSSQAVNSGAIGADTRQFESASIIGDERTVRGNLGDANDVVLEDGRPIDRYRVIVQSPGQAVYGVAAMSPEIPVVSTVSFFDPALQQLVPLQRAHVFSAGQPLLYAGAFPQPGEYIVDIFSLDAQQPIGTYALKFCRDDDDDDDDFDDGLDDGLDELDDCLDDDDSGDWFDD